jgi:magnesium transporter
MGEIGAVASSNKELLNSKIARYTRSVETVLIDEWSIEEALARLREKPLKTKILYFYVTDREGKLVGILPTRKFLLSYPSTKIHEVMERDFIRLHVDSSVEKAMQIFVDERLLALPVIGSDDKLLGVIDVYVCIQEGFETPLSHEFSQDIFQLIGVSLEQKQLESAWFGFRSRMPWLVFNIIGGLTCAAISDYFEVVLAQYLMLAMFIPLVLTLSESVSMQAMTMSLQSMHGSGRISLKSFFGRIWNEWRTVSLLGLVSGLGVGLASILWEGGMPPSIIIASSIYLSMCCSALFGTLLPIGLHAVKLDPKLAAGPIVLMLADIFTTFVYLGLATMWLLP